MEFDLVELPAGVTSEVSVLLVGYQQDPKHWDGRVPVLERLLASLGNDHSPSLTYASSPILKFSLPASSSDLTKLRASSTALSATSTIQWAIVVRDAPTGFEDAVEISIR